MLSSRCSQPLAILQSRWAVCSEILSTSSGLLHAESSEEAQLHELAFARIEGSQSRQGMIHGDQICFGTSARGDRILQAQRRNVAAAFQRLPAAAQIDQDAPHRARTYGEEVRPVLPGWVRRFEETQVCLVHQGCGLQRMVRPFMSYVVLSQPTQLVIDQRYELIERALIAFTPGVEQFRYVASLRETGAALGDIHSGKATMIGR